MKLTPTIILLLLLAACFAPVRAQESDREKAIRLYRLGNEDVAKADFTAAIVKYSQAIELYPHVIEFFFNRAIAYRSIRRFDLSVKDFEHVITLNPQLPTPMWVELYVALGTAYQENEEYSKSVETLTKVLALDTVNVKALHNRGNTYVFQKEYDKALADFNRALELEPTALGYYSRARLLTEIKDESKAIPDYTKATQLNPRFDAAFSNRGMLFQARGDLTSALQDFSRAISIEPGDGVYYFNRANIFVIQKQYTSAIKDYSRALEIFPRWAEAWRRRAEVYRKIGKPASAAADLRKSKQVEKDGFVPTNKIELFKP